MPRATRKDIAAEYDEFLCDNDVLAYEPADTTPGWAVRRCLLPCFVLLAIVPLCWCFVSLFVSIVCGFTLAVFVDGLCGMQHVR